MNETLILLLGSDPTEPVRWAFWSNDRIHLADMSEGVAGLSAIADRASSADNVVAILHGEDATMRTIGAPPKSNAHLTGAANLLLEDDLAESLSAVHTTTLRHQSGAGLVIAVKKSVIENWRSALDEAGIEPDILTVDFSLLSLAPGRTTIIDLHDRVIGAAGLRGFAIDRAMADALVTSLLTDNDMREVILYGEQRVDIQNSENLHVDWRGPASDEALFTLFANDLNAGNSLNLLQGEYRKRWDWRNRVGPWRRAAMLAAACFIGFISLTIADGVRSLRLASQLDADAMALHVAAFPDAVNADPKAHARNILATRSSPSQFLPLSATIADSLSENTNIQIDRVRYNAARGEFSLNLQFSDISELEAFKNELASRGVIANEAGGVLRVGGVYRSELRIAIS